MKLSNMMQFMNDFASNFQSSLRESSALRPSSASMRPTSSSVKYGMLTTHVWPKSRMLFAVVSKMAKEGLLNP